MDLIRVSDDVLEDAAALHPLELRTLDAIHVATALLLGDDLAYVVTYDMRMASAAQTLGCTVATPS